MSQKALEGINVLDFSREAAGPITARYLANNGATVVRVESEKAPDGARSVPPFGGGSPGLNKSCFQAKFNADKYGIALNMNHPKAREYIIRLIQWADVVVESYLPGQMAKWKLDYNSIRNLKPDIIMCSLSTQGQEGPHATHPGFGMHLVSGSGITNLLGYSKVSPIQPFGAYTDWIAPRFAASYILAALDYRRRTGQGQYIDLSQFEAVMQFLAPLVLDYSCNGREFQRQGNRSSTACPHEAYRCQGDDRWCVIAVQTDQEWQNFCRFIGNPPWTAEPKFSTLPERKKHEEELNNLIEAWTMNHRAEEVEKSMQENGVPAGVVKTTEDLFNDPQLEYRHHFWKVNHTEIGEYSQDGINFHLSKTPGEITRGGNCLGEHTAHVCLQILGMSAEEFVTLDNEGLFR